MSDFWPTLLAGLVGALVGGAFTAFGAWFQTRGLIRVTSRQIDEALRQGIELTRREVKVEAALELLRALGLLRSAIHKIEEGHSGHPPRSCEAPDLNALLSEHIAALDRALLLYQRIFSDGEDVYEALAILLDFLDHVITRSAPSSLRPQDRRVLDCMCATAAWCDAAAELINDASAVLGEAMAIEVGLRKAVEPSERTESA